MGNHKTTGYHFYINKNDEMVTYYTYMAGNVEACSAEFNCPVAWQMATHPALITVEA